MTTNKAGIYPTADRVVIRPVEVEEITPGGIVLPQTTKDKEDMAQCHGIIVAVGEEAALMPELKGIEVGDMVIHARHAGLTYIGKDAVKYRLMRAGDVLAKTEGVWDKRFRSSIPMPGV